MIKKVAVICICFIFFVSAAACQTENKKSTETAKPSKTDEITVKQTDTESFITIPLSERKFVYTNGLNIVDNNDEYKEGANAYYYKNYPIISGIKNKDIEKRLNNEILETFNSEMQGLEQSLTKEPEKMFTIDTRQGNAYISYNCNNVIFIDYNFHLSANSGGDSVYKSKFISQGYDLNTGNKLKLEDLFVKNSNYEELINDAVVMYIIENNFDDPEAELMKKPFQGIREGQNFSFNTNSLRIIIDEKNDEFVNAFNTTIIEIPLYVFEDILVIFDKYYNEEVNLFEKEPLKQLLPNRIEYKETKTIEDFGKNYQVVIREGEFKNVNNGEVKVLLDDLTKYNLDSSGLVERAKAQQNVYSNANYGIGHYVYLSMNAGGYISAVAHDWAEEDSMNISTWRVVNFDLNKNKPMKLKDLFVEKFDYKAKIAEIVVDSEYHQLMDGSRISKEDITALSEEKFNFSEGDVSISFDKLPKEKYGTFVNIGFDQIGMENLAIYK